MSDWKGKSKGSVFGYKVFVFLLKNLGVKPAYFLLYFVAFYYLLTSFKTNKYTYIYFRKRHQFSILKSIIGIYKTYLQLGKSLIDRIAISTDLQDKFTFEFDGIDHIQKMIDSAQGGLIFTAHIGNFNVAQRFFDRFTQNQKMYMVITDAEHRQIKDYISQLVNSNVLQLIVIKEDMSHIFEINQAIQNNEIIIFAADRSGKGRQIYTTFLGKASPFFEGPFKLAAQKKLPILFAYIMREPKSHYHLYARPFISDDFSKKNILNNYIASLEKMVKKYPYQWFNFYDFWEEFNSYESN
ncbi:lipid A biosynthesis acyltransferase [Mesonia sp. K7]|uniref:LpxL/LpxP family acyltransferase n=1 Tax=Mesonia sp. K7 TaxID=2218606 RepID=UPI000DA9E334|nr:lipid A biosynthesis acyltransferase [Mesonia sp. K7]PZD76822.1 lipid A biosynthesis acyltransferase [Mesonia sp. K7]